MQRSQGSWWGYGSQYFAFIFLSRFLFLFIHSEHPESFSLKHRGWIWANNFILYKYVDIAVCSHVYINYSKSCLNILKKKEFTVPNEVRHAFGRQGHLFDSQPCICESSLSGLPTSFPSCILAPGRCSVAQAASDFLCVPCWCSIYIKESIWHSKILTFNLFEPLLLKLLPENKLLSNPFIYIWRRVW